MAHRWRGIGFPIQARSLRPMGGTGASRAQPVACPKIAELCAEVVLLGLTYLNSWAYIYTRAVVYLISKHGISSF